MRVKQLFDRLRGVGCVNKFIGDTRGPSAASHASKNKCFYYRNFQEKTAFFSKRIFRQPLFFPLHTYGQFFGFYFQEHSLHHPLPLHPSTLDFFVPLPSPPTSATSFRLTVPNPTDDRCVSVAPSPPTTHGNIHICLNNFAL